MFTAGVLLLIALYTWQVRQLDEPTIVPTETARITDLSRGITFETQLVDADELARAYMQELEQRSYRRSLDELRQASFFGLGVLAIVAFGSGWLLSGWTLRPVGRMAAVARDISGRDLSRRIALNGPDDELKDLADTFDEMLDRLQTSFEDQRRFVQDTSHELRNPLAVTSTNLELVLDDPEADEAELREAARIAHASVGRISRIVDELVDQARQGVPAAQAGTVDLVATATDVVAEFSPTAGRRDVRIALTAPPAPVEVRGEPAALRRALANLVANPVRLSPAGSTITIQVRPGTESASILVTDEGPGIPAPDVERVFDRFWRGEQSGKGLGLGLSIVQRVAERHGGSVSVASEPGVGSTFTFTVPMVIARP
ncbi:MAG: HAMP domain-containing sensor histidine kinase [Actinomycetota bacterium]